MNRQMLAILFVLVFLVSAASAYTVNSISISPSGTLTTGTTVDLSLTVLEPTGNTNANNLVMYTALANPTWSYTIYVNGAPNGVTSSTASKVTISSFLLDYRSNDTVSVGVTLEGTAPPVSQTSNQNIFEIYEIDSNGNPVGTPYIQSASVIGSTVTAATPTQTTLVTTVPTTTPTTIQAATATTISTATSTTVPATTLTTIPTTTSTTLPITVITTQTNSPTITVTQTMSAAPTVIYTAAQSTATTPFPTPTKTPTPTPTPLSPLTAVAGICAVLFLQMAAKRK